MSEETNAAPAAETAPAESNETSNESNTEETENLEISTEEASAETSEEEPSEETVKEETVNNLMRKFKLKVDGKEIEEEVDLSDEDYLTRQLQLAKAAQKRMQESASLRKDVEQFVSLFKNDPVEAMKRLGMDADEFAEQHINKRIEEMQLSPEEKAKRELQSELEKLRKEREDALNSKQQIEFERLQEKYANQLDQEITEAISSNKKLPHSPYVVKRIADSMMMAIEEGYEDVTVTDVLPLVEQQITEEIQQMFATMPEEVIEAVVGKDTLNKLRKSRLQRAKKQIDTAQDIKPTTLEPKNEKNDEPEKKIAARDYFRNLGTR